MLIALVLALVSIVSEQAVEQPTATPVPAPPMAVASPTPVVQADGVRDIICSPQFTWDCERAVGIAYCESRFVATATGKLGEKGWFQLRPEFHQQRADRLFGSGADLYDPV